MKKLASFLLGLMFCAASAFANPKQTLPLPPSAVLTYSVNANYNGLPVSGQSIISWTNQNKSYVVTDNTTSHLFGNVLSAKSQGLIDAQGLVPVTYTERHMRKSPKVTQFSDTGTTVTFANGSSQTLKQRAFDRANIIWQLIGNINPEHFDATKKGSWTFTLAGKRNCDNWTFSVTKEEKLSTPMGNINTLVVIGQSTKGKRISAWLSKEHHGYPVQIQWADSKLTLTQTITQIKTNE